MADDGEIALAVHHLAIGQTLKVLRLGTYQRADIIDKENVRIKDEDPAHDGIKVHWWGTKPAEDKWVWLKDCRLIKQFTVDWKDIQLKLPLAQDPESRRTRKEVFESWKFEVDRKGVGLTSLSLAELKQGIENMLRSDLGDDMEEVSKAVEYAHKATRKLSPSKKKGGAKRVDFKEFHGFIHAFRYYLELAELFEHLDANQEDDQKLSLREVRRGLDRLEEWGVTNELLEKEFKGIDVWTPKWKFADFAKFCIETRWSKMDLMLELDSSDSEVEEEKARHELLKDANAPVEKLRRQASDLEFTIEKNRIINAFKVWDKDGSGKITQEELAQVLIALNATLNEETAKSIFEAADENFDGEIDVEEFCHWIFSQDEL